jgi:hypothetical protein
MTDMTRNESQRNWKDQLSIQLFVGGKKVFPSTATITAVSLLSQTTKIDDTSKHKSIIEGYSINASIHSHVSITLLHI